MSKAQKSEIACPHKCAQDCMCLEKKSQAYNCAETRQRKDRQAMVCVYQTLRRGRETIDKQWSVCTRPFTQCARLQCMYTPTVGAHLGSLCMRALPHFGLDTCNTLRYSARLYVRKLVKPRETPRNPAIPARYQRDTSAIPARNPAKPARNCTISPAKPARNCAIAPR